MSRMTIFRAAHRVEFTQIENAVVRPDGQISARAVGVLAYLLSHSDGWDTSAERLASVFTEGLHAIKVALRELEDAGHLVRQKRNTAQGMQHEWLLYEEPIGRFSTDGPRGESEPTGRFPTGGESTGIKKTNLKKSSAPSERALPGDRRLPTLPPGADRPEWADTHAGADGEAVAVYLLERSDVDIHDLSDPALQTLDDCLASGKQHPKQIANLIAKVERDRSAQPAPVTFDSSGWEALTRAGERRSAALLGSLDEVTVSIRDRDDRHERNVG